jgi:nicotinate-nucleotide adenylyltransferase
MIRLGLFGGTFDPVHYGHLRTVSGARQELGLPQVLLMPNPFPPHKLLEPLTDYQHRKEMLRLALQEFPDLQMADFEERAIGAAYTSDTVRRVIATLPDGPRELWLIIGADSLIELPLWKDPEVLFHDTKVAVLPRPGCSLDHVSPGYLSRVRILRTPYIDISSTEIRRRLQAGESVYGMLPPSVLAYVREHGLYGTGGA